MTAMDARLRTERELIRLTQPGSLLNRDSHRSTAVFYDARDKQRRKFHTELIESYTADAADLGKDGSAAIITAGPPGAGKSTEVEKLGLTGYRVIDPDVIKEHLLEKARRDGIFDDLLRLQLEDGRTLLPNELASLVHNESADLANAILRRSIEDGVNVAIEGTFSWPILKDRYLEWLLTGEYSYLTVVNVEVNRDTAISQASERWWGGREKAFAGTGSLLGGRFTPPEAIDALYTTGAPRASTCNANAVAFFNDPRADLFDEVTLYVYDRTGSSDEQSIYVARNGVREGDSPAPLGVAYRGLSQP
ncbi:zeta toxin family protein [Paenarthrobacter aurescens]|uniref:UDP-N-acetylglucosamine kinase n=1 Tax=Paenarthrobacter aurescens TaxID=43663 RepID=A0A4Y3NIZ2_PAEAU|nr:zeta toxin family protein [Paenarthrobacter aurescens]MDO6141888.1 zeta toxin family protein [Paenarthrobacter aurescens]MDO6145693.1 zeta toxin family protein [Paenarthrobacter aurescens]MDO6156937.1 zeta toxin family protein [Paenarthrobacter aurescens]MDO6160923.1 zeta toxin family protein [Paenarthrobacter aurescens]GEB19096.1 hypothetical protein AAU01_18510 [Paenarthrobacter aurescens]